jgi:hypothetical protein
LAIKIDLEIQSHYTFTTDGFILCLHRLVDSPIKPNLNDPNSSGPVPEIQREKSNKIKKKIPVFFFHDLMLDSESFLCCNKENSIAYSLHEEGHDVWLMNNRSNRYSHDHTRYTTSDK